MTITLSATGDFERNGAPFIPVGVNYWPGSCGVELWREWPADEIRHDLDVIARLGLNTIRFFLRWQDFEPEPGQYDERMFSRLTEMLRWCAERNIIAQPSLFVGWMSGGIFWPEWKGERNLFADSWIVERSIAFARRAAQVIAPFHEHLLGIDLGNELCCLPESSAAPPEAVINWCAAISNAVRDGYPAAIIVSGNEQNQLLNDTGWRFGEQPGTDYLSMHGYPVPEWHSVPFDGMTDPLCQSLLPLYVKCARAFGPVMLQEFGTIITFGARQQDAYLRAMLPACRANGANGFLWWCLRDIHAAVHPYRKHSFESALGLVDANDQVKPGLGYFLEFARQMSSNHTAPPVERPTIGLYWPKHYYLRNRPENPGNDPRPVSRRLALAHYLLEQLGYSVRIIRGDQPLRNLPQILVIAGTFLSGDEIEALEPWVYAGGRILWHGPDPVNWGYAAVRLLGARPVDYRAPLAATIALAGETWRYDSYPRGMCVEVEPDTADVLATDTRGLPMVIANPVGRGKVTAALPLVEDAIAAVAGDRLTRDRWGAWYAALLQ